MTRIQRATHLGIAVVATLVTLACNDDGGPAGNTGSIQVTANPTALSVVQGGNTSVTVTLTRAGGFTGVVTLAVSGLPTGITTTITPPQLSGTVTSATITVTAVASVAPQVYTGTITATAQNVTQATATYQLTVTVAPNYALTVPPAAVTIPAGTTGGTTVTIDRTAFDGGVALALLDPPSGITGAFSPTPSTTNASTLVVSVAASVAPGSYPLTIQGTATGPGVKTTTLAVTVTAPPAGGTRVAYQFCDASDVPAFFAYQDGSGVWQPVVGSTPEDVLTYEFDIRQGRGGVLVVYGAPSATIADVLGVDRRAGVPERPTRRLHIRDRIRARSTNVASRAGALRRSLTDVYQTYVSYASAAELVQAGIDNCEETVPTKTVTGTVAGVAFRQFGIMSLGITTELFEGGRSTNPVTFTDVPGGLADFVATRMSAGSPPDKAVIFRNLDIPDGGSLPATVDFNAPTALVPAVASATITGGDTDNVEIFTELVTANGASLLWFDLAPSRTNPRPWAGIGPADMASGDFHTVVVFATETTNETDFRVSLKYVGPVADQALALGPTITAPATSLVASGAYPRFRFQGSIPQEYDKGVAIEVLSEANLFSLIATSAYLTASGGAAAYDFTMPNVAALAGFPAAARLAAGPREVFASVFGFSGPGIFDPLPTLGSQFKGATAGTTITVP